MAATLAITGCGSGGYIGGGIQSLSRNSAVIDATQSIVITANVSAGLPLSWSMNAPSCAGEQSFCGSISAAAGNTVTYTAPNTVSASFQVQLIATVPGTSDTSTATVTVNPAPEITGRPPSGVLGQAYTTTLVASGGTGALTLAQSGGQLPPGLTFNAATGVISGTPSAIGTFNIAVSVTDQSDIPLTITTQETITVVAQQSSALVISGAPGSGTVGTAYAAQLTASGGVAPYTWSVTSGALPTGLSLSPTSGLISGIPTAQGTFAFTVMAQDSAATQATASFVIAIAARSSTLTLATSTLPSGTVGIAYSATIGVSGGTAPYTCALASGSLPAGLTLAANCGVSGTPTTAGTSSFMVKATDSASPANTVTGPESITINAAAVTLTLSSPPAGTVGTMYTGSIGVSGGVAPYSCSVASGSVPAGLTLNANCSLTGTPTTAGTATPMVKATDSSNPANTTTSAVSITINPAAVTLTLTPPPAGTVGTPYAGSVGVSGGTAPYSCSLAGGAVPAGLTLNANCSLTGTPTTAGTSTPMVKATDSSNPANTTTSAVSIVINPAAVTLTLTPPPAGTVGTPYTGSVGVSGGTAPYSCSLAGGAVPAGLTLNANCSLTGTPTTSGTTSATVKATDSSSPANTTTGSVSITINPAGVTLTFTPPPAGTVGTPYTGSIGVSGGTPPYTCTLASGTLPAGLTLNANCSLTGTPTMSGSTTVSVTATDGGVPPNTTTGSVTITVNPAPVTLTLTPPPAGTVGTPYTGSVGVSGGTAPYTCMLSGGTLPAGLTLNANCSLTGTPTTSGTTSATITATDSSSPKNTTTGSVSITINPIPPLTLTLTGSLPYAVLGQAYSQTLQATGGEPPYTYAITAGSLPAGISLSTGGVISGTPTAVGASSFTVTATDSETPAQMASLPLVLLVVYPSTSNDSWLNGPYAFLFQGYDDVVLGVLAYQTGTIGSFTANGTGALTAGELDANHQTSTSTTNTVTTNKLLGTYTIGADGRGTMAITPLNADGTTGSTTVYAIAVKAPVSPATTVNKGTMIEYDDANLVGTRGSGTFLAQTSTAFAGGLTGSYAFGMSGDTPCLLACTFGIIGGPAASVGEFAISGTSISGAGDANIATTNIANSSLSGSVAAADADGRVQLSMTATQTPNGVYPADYAVYMVNGSQAFVMSTDVHSAYILLAGSMMQQTQTAFTDASLAGPFIGYENSPTNPGLAGVALNNVLNLSTATIFSGYSNSAGTCTTTHVDQGGTTGLVNGLTGLGSGAPILNALLGTYASTGTSNCTVAANGRAALNYPVPDTALTTILQLLGLSTTPPPARTVYLAGPSQGYFLETGYAGLGYLAAQTGEPFTLGTLDGTYTYGTIPAASLASTNASGIFTANGQGNATETLDENVGVGNINLLELGTTGSQTYTLTDPTAGRFLMTPSTVIYAISPSQFVLLDTSATTTSPSVALLQ